MYIYRPCSSLRCAYMPGSAESVSRTASRHSNPFAEILKKRYLQNTCQEHSKRHAEIEKNPAERSTISQKRL